MTEENKKTVRKLTGTVVSDKMNKTVVVSVERKFSHPKFKKVVRRTTKYHCHDEKNECATGDFVSMREVRPLSKLKRWSLVEIIKPSVGKIEKEEKVG